MSGIVKFEDGETAFLRDPRNVPNKLRNPVKHARTKLGAIGIEFDEIEDEKQKIRELVKASAENPELTDDFNENLMLALVDKWSYEFPVSREGLGELPGHAYDKLLVRCQELSNDLFPNFEPSMNEATPTTPSGD